MSEYNNRYKNGKIYTIRYRNDDSLIYVGSSVQPLYKRWFGHKTKRFNKKDKSYNLILYKKSKRERERETDINDWYIELYENFPVGTKEQLLKTEEN